LGSSTSVSYEGRFWRFPELSLRPRVYQQPHPPLHEVASPPASVARVGARGWPVAMHFTPTAVVAQCVEEYHAALAMRGEPAYEGPYRPRLLLGRETYVAETPEQARAEGALALQGFWYLSSLAAPPAEYTEERLKALTSRVWGGRTYDELEAIGVDALLLVYSFGNLSHAQVCRSLELFAAAVIRPQQAVATPVSR
jgi:alkanesulfonate monooxygenase SsuD/methylene tetrahydromethanopterin reductase-like flavin-dependent oxidoreductase (luciferase family)